ncbi:unnamed protein product [Linum tenue]|uniref:Bulb-type lectin domain-containing protein n=1 Tax=Linum tenue TaxID=586396 RepID=A0AAV0GSE0_9ROSI|nr:unnamed protein product [Linum tenue]
MAGLALVACAFILCFSITCCNAKDTINPGQPLRDGDTTLVSAGRGRFELGFFSSVNSRNRYLGIWYTNITPQTVVWVANRETPIQDTLGVVNLTSQGNLTLFDGNQTLVWSSNSSSPQSPVVQLLDSGNLVLDSLQKNDTAAADNFL